MKGVTDFLLPELLEILDERVTINLTEDSEDSENFQSQNGNSTSNRQRVVLVRTINHADQTMTVLDQAYSIVAHFNPTTIERIKKKHGYKSLSLLKGGVLRITKYHFSTPARCFANRKQKRPQRSVTARSHQGDDEYRITLWVDDFSVVADDELAVSSLPHVEENVQVTRLLKTMGHNELDTTLLRRQCIVPSPFETEGASSSTTTSPAKQKQFSDSNPLLDEDCEIPEDQEDALNQVEGWGEEVEKTDSQIIEENGDVPMTESQGVGVSQPAESQPADHFQQENVKKTFIQCSDTDTDEDQGGEEKKVASTEVAANLEEKSSSSTSEDAPERSHHDDDEEPNSQSEIIYDDGMQYCTQQPDGEESQVLVDSEMWHTQPQEDNSMNSRADGKRVTFNLDKSPQKSIPKKKADSPTKEAEFALAMDSVEAESQVQDDDSAPGIAEMEEAQREEEDHEENVEDSEAEETQLSAQPEIASDCDEEEEEGRRSEPDQEDSHTDIQVVKAAVQPHSLMQKVAAATSLLIDAGTAALHGLKRSHVSATEANELANSSPKRRRRENSTALSPDYGHDVPPSRVKSSLNSRETIQEQSRSVNNNIKQRKFFARRSVPPSESNSNSANSSRHQASRRYEHLFPPMKGDLLKSLISGRGR